MFSSFGGRDETRRLLFTRILAGQLNNVEELQFSLRELFQRRMEECENEIVIETNKNKNYLHEKDMNYKLYPLYINWKKIEANENEYYLALVHFGYFGANIYSTFKELYPGLKVKNIFFTFASFIQEFLNNPKNTSQEMTKEVEKFMSMLPELNIIYSLIKNKILMYKEIPMFLIILKIYEIYSIFNKGKGIVDLLKNEYLLVSYMTEDEYKEIYSEHFSGKVCKIFKEIVKKFDRNYELPKTREKYINHLKILFQKFEKCPPPIVNENENLIINVNDNANYIELNLSHNSF